MKGEQEHRCPNRCTRLPACSEGAALALTSCCWLPITARDPTTPVPLETSPAPMSTRGWEGAGR